MKTLVLSLNFAPELTGIGKYSADMVDGLLARGHEVFVVCAPPHYPHWRVAEGYHALSYQFESPRPGLTVCRCPTWVPRRPGGLKRLLHLASFALSSLPVMLLLALWRPATVFAVMPAMFAAPWAWLTARLCGARAWLHVQDFELDAAFELGLLRGRFARRLAQVIERRVLGGFDTVSTISHRMLVRLTAKGVAPGRASLLPNGIDLGKIRPITPSQSMRRELGIADDQRVCLFAGTMNRKQGIHLLVQAARRLQLRRDVVIVLSGDGEFRATLQAQAQGLSNARFLDLCPAERFNELLNMADIHLLPQLRGAADLVMPSKLSGMLASGRPIIAAAAPGTEIATVVAGCGLVIEPECDAAFAGAIEQLSDDHGARQRMGAAARSFAQRHLSNAHLFDRLAKELAGMPGDLTESQAIEAELGLQQA